MPAGDNARKSAVGFVIFGDDARDGVEERTQAPAFLAACTAMAGEAVFGNKHRSTP